MNVLPSISIKRTDFLGQQVEESLVQHPYVLTARGTSGGVYKMPADLARLAPDVDELYIKAVPERENFGLAFEHGPEQIFKATGDWNRRMGARADKLIEVIAKRTPMRWSPDGRPEARQWMFFYVHPVHRSQHLIKTFTEGSCGQASPINE